jgi:hypothetical protein
MRIQVLTPLMSSLALMLIQMALTQYPQVPGELPHEWRYNQT